MRKIRVLIVDDSVVIRRLLSGILEQDPEIEVVGTAANGSIALAKLPQVTPDLVTMDVEMPVMDGLATVAELRKAYPKLPVIMFSTLTERGAIATFDALARGANDYVAKPANVGSVAAGMESVKSELIPRIKALCPFHQSSGHSAVPAVRPVGRVTTQSRCDAVVIGSSTGGPQALSSILSKLPGDFPAPIIIVQHMPPVFTKHLANRLNQECRLSVCEAESGEAVESGKVFIAPGGLHLEIQRQGTAVRTKLTESPPENSCRPAVDVLFRSAAKVYGGNLLAVVLTGMGQDGKRGAEAITGVGGTVIAQDEASSVVWGMPRAVTEAGLASIVVSLNGVPSELVRIVSRQNRRTLAGMTSPHCLTPQD
ncbi:MAG: chemotaxis response regulator protein-glutamate methylesterase [Planctomycetaceae bacterium]